MQVEAGANDRLAGAAGDARSTQELLRGVFVADAENKNILAPSIEDKDLYKNVLDTRNFEISLFWQRSNYFLVLNSALALGFFNIRTPSYEYCLAIFGVTVSSLWFLINLGSKFWQSVWENRLSRIEIRIAPELRLFAASRAEIDDDAWQSIANNRHAYLFQRLVDQMVLWKPSVSFLMTLLSIFFVIGWVVLFIISVVSHHSHTDPLLL